MVFFLDRILNCHGQVWDYKTSDSAGHDDIPFRVHSSLLSQAHSTLFCATARVQKCPLGLLFIVLALQGCLYPPDANISHN